MACKGTCYRIKVSVGFGKKYTNGLKRCTECEIYTRWEGNFCPCCNQQLRTTPLSTRRYKKAKEIKIEN